MSLFESEYKIKIQFYDLDPMNVVWHGNYIKYLEEARCDLFNKLNYTYFDMKRDDYVYPIAKMQTKYIQPLVFNQEIIIKTTLEEISPAIIINYTMFDTKTNKKVFEAKTTQIGVIISTKESVYEPPSALKKALEMKKNEN